MTIATAAPPAPAVVLDPASVQNTVNGVAYTTANNSASHPAPIFDVSGVLPNAWVELFRGASYVGFAQAGALGGTVKVADTLGGTIPDSPAGVPYQYTAKQVDVAGNQGPTSIPATPVIVDTKAPLNPPVVLDPASDTGSSQTDGITQITLTKFPSFNVGAAALPVEQGATVNLYRNGKIVATLANVSPVGGVVKITDAHSIPDGTYTYGAQQQDLAGNYSGLGVTEQVTYVTVAPSSPQAPALDPASQTGQGSGSTTNTSPTFDVGGVVAGATLTLLRNGSAVATLANVSPVGGVVKITDLGPVADGVYNYSAFQVDVAGNTSPIGPASPLTIGPGAPSSITLDAATDSATKGDNITNFTSPTFDVGGVLSGANLELLRNGSAVATLANVSPVGGVVKITDPGAVPDGAYNYSAFQVDQGVQSPPSPNLAVTILTTAGQPGLTLDPGSDSGVKGDGITNAVSPTFDVTNVAIGATITLLRNGTAVTTAPGGAGGTAQITDPGPAPDGVYSYSVKQTDAAGNVSPASGLLSLTIDTQVPAATVVSLDPSSQTGPTTTANPKPTIDVGNIVVGATVKLFRNGTLVKSVPNSATTSFTFTEPTALPNGAVTYTSQQTTVAGNASGMSSLTVTVNTAATPAAPTVSLDPASQSTPGNGQSTTVASNLVLDVAGVLPGATVKLLRGGVTVATITSAAGGTVAMTDPGPLTPGPYAYTAQQTSAANVQSSVGAAFNLTIVSAVASTSIVPGDYYGDGKTDVAVYGYGRFAVRPSGGGVGSSVPFGGPNDQFVLGDFDGPKTDLAVYGYGRLAYKTLDGSSSGTVAFGTSTDQFVEGDFDGDGRSDAAVYGPGAGGAMRLLYRPSSGGPDVTVIFGAPGDVPAPGYYNGGSKTYFAVFRPSTAQWFVAGIANPIQFGAPGDIPVPGMYDTAGVTELAVFRPSTDQWFIRGQAQPIQFGGPGDIPAPGMYDGGQKTELAVFRPGSGQFFIAGHPSPITFGGARDVPVTAPLGFYQNGAQAAHSVAGQVAQSLGVATPAPASGSAGKSVNLGSTAATLSARATPTSTARSPRTRVIAAAPSKSSASSGVTRLLSPLERAHDAALAALSAAASRRRD